MMPNIFEYLDFRQYLVDVFRALKKQDKKASMRSFARMANSTSPNFLQLIRDRKLNIQESSVRSLSENLALGKKEMDYFLVLVNFDQAKSYKEKEEHFKEILRTREYRQIKTITKEHYNFYSHWYMPVIRELVVHPKYSGDVSWIAKRIDPPISEKKVEKGIRLLEKLRLIKRNDGNGKWEMTDKVISTPTEVSSVALYNYHQKVIELGKESIERFETAQRDIRSVALGLSQENFEEIKKRYQAFWKEILAFADKEQNVSRVYQANMQLFPLSKEE